MLPLPLLLTASPVTVTVTSQATGNISPFVYGTNEADWSGTGRYLTLGRQGGNRWTAYNWENNASNAGNDYYNQNDAYLGGGDTPGEAVRSAVIAALPAKHSILVTVPMAGYVAADKLGNGDVANTPNYLSTRFRPIIPKKNGAFEYPPDLNDGAVYVDEFVSWLEKSFPNRSAVSSIAYSLDNEPDLWYSTHSRIHPQPVTYAEMVAKTTATAAAIKDVAPKATIYGFVSYGFSGYKNLQAAPDNNGRDFINFFLDSMKSAEAQQGRRLLDVLDLHWYPEAIGGGIRITGNDTSAASVAARVQAPRSLWDPTYTETSWITQYVTNGPIKLVPTLRDQIAGHYPGTKLAFTEYNYGASGHISGAVAQADALGVFGREGVYAACYWPLTTDNRFAHAAFDAFRNYDGKGGQFGDIELSATSSNVANVTVYASRFSNATGKVVVLINKSTAATPVTLKLDSMPLTMTSYTLQGTTPQMVSSRLGMILGTTGALTLPAMSVSTIVLK